MPGRHWLTHYRRADLRPDLVAGVTVAIMLVPQAMAYAMLAGLPPVVGLYASTVPLVLYALVGTSRQVAVGPVALDSMLVLASLSVIATPGSPEYIGLAALLMLMVGAVQLLMGAFRAGYLVNFLAHPVVSGFTSAAAIIIAASQLRHLMGIPLPTDQPVYVLVIEAIGRLPETHAATALVGAAAIGCLIAIRRWAPRLPAALTMVVLATLAVALFDLDAGGVATVGTVPGGLPPIQVPTIDGATLRTLAPAALTIAFIGFMESYSVAKVLAHSHGTTLQPDRELLGLGAANFGGAFFGGYPVTGGFSRSAVNDRAGARTQLASVVTACLVALVLLFFTPLFAQLPKAALAAMIMVAVFGLIDVAAVRHLWAIKPMDLALLALTFAATLILGAQWGLLVGISASLLEFVVRTTRPHYAVLGQLGEDPIWRNVIHFPDAHRSEGLLALRFDAAFYFGNVSFLEARLAAEEAAAPWPLRAVLLDMSGVNTLDATAADALVTIAEGYRARGIQLLLSAIKGPVRAVIARTRLPVLLGEDAQFLTTPQAVAAYDAGLACPKPREV